MNKLFTNLGGFLLAGLMVFTTSCERDLAELELATFPTNGDVFIDGFTGGLNYAAFGGSDVTAFDTDTEIKYSGTTSMRFAVPDFEAPEGAYAGGTLFLDSGRDLTGYTALTFWARASKAANIDIIGFGDYLGGNENVASVSDLAVNTNWKKYYIPIPDPSVLTAERGMLFYSEGPEDGRGYTFWIDEVKFENLGTIVPVSSGIFGGENREETVETGAIFNAGGFATFSLPTGVNQRVAASPNYFTYTSSDPSVATVDADGQVTVVDAGEATITATLGGEDAEGSLKITSTGEAILPSSAAPTPTQDADDVISIFSNAYTDVPVDFYNGFWEFSTTQSAVVQVEGDDIIRYSQLNFVGIQFTAPTIDATGVNRIHIDIYTPDATAAPANFKLLVVDLGADGSFGGNDDSSHEITITAPELQTNGWVSIDRPLSDFTGLTSRGHLAQIVLSGTIPNIFMDNLYLYDGDGGGGGGGGGTEPPMAAPAPTRNADNVISLFSDAYDDVTIDTWRTDWSMATFEDVTIAGNATKKYSELDFAGIDFAENQIDASGMTNLHLDIWSGDWTFFGIKLVDFGADGAFDGGDDTEYQINIPMPAQSTWIGYDFLLSDFTDLANTANIAQIVLVAQPSAASTIYVDNVYFFNNAGGGGGGDGAPTVAAPAPTQNAADVISLFSEAYDDVPVDTWRTDWSSATFEDITIAGNAVKKYSELDFAGIETAMNQIDATGMTNFRMDVWSADFTNFAIKLVDFGADGGFEGGDDTEFQLDISMPAQGQWVSLDLPLADFTDLTSTGNLAQFIIVGQPTGTTTVYIDNVYFYDANGTGGGGGGGGGDTPGVAAPTPSLAAANVISLFSDAYTDVPVTTFRTDWSSGVLEDLTIAGNATKKYSALDFVGIETTGNQIDATTMTHFHIDVWTADGTSFGIKLVDFGADGAFEGGDDAEHQLNFPDPAQGQWVSYDIPLSDFTGLTTRAHMSQYILVGLPSGSNTLFMDNMYFHN